MCKKRLHIQIILSSFRFLSLKTYVLGLFLLFIVLSNQAQTNSQSPAILPNLQVGVSAGTSIFFGDIKQYRWAPVSNYMNEWRFAGGINFNYSISPAFTIRLQGLYGKLSGTWRAENIWFENEYYELNLNTAINFNNLFGKNREDRLVNLYGTIGFGIMNFNTIIKRLGEYYVLKRVGYGYGTGVDGMERQEFLMAGLGIDFRVSKRFSILLETSNKFTFTDNIDGLESGQYNDVSNYTSIGLSYRFAYLKKRKNEEVKEKIVYPILVPSILESRNINYSLETNLDYVLAETSHETTLPIYIEEESITSPSKIEYRVQIRARRYKPLPLIYLSNKYNIPVSELKQDLVKDYYVYSTGSFSNYLQAKRMCDELKTGPGLEGAFVVAFKDGVRIFPVNN